MAMGNGRGLGGLNVDINVTPLIDVLLVLLITFMVIVPVPPHGLDAQVPQRSDSDHHDAEASIVVEILKEHSGQISYRINQDVLSFTHLESRLRDIFALRANRILFIKGDGNLEFSTVAEVMDIAKSAGADHIGLITPKDGI